MCNPSSLESNPRPPQWKHGVLTTGLPREVPHLTLIRNEVAKNETKINHYILQVRSYYHKIIFDILYMFIQMCFYM